MTTPTRTPGSDVPLLTTKLYAPPARPNLVPRPRLVERLNEGPRSGRKLTLISAPAGFGKTTLVSEWVAGCGRPTAWLSLDEGDNNPTRFLAYLVAALQMLALSADGTSEAEGIAARQSSVGNIREGVLGMPQSPQPPPTETILTALLNEITTVPDNFIRLSCPGHWRCARHPEVHAAGTRART